VKTLTSFSGCKYDPLICNILQVSGSMCIYACAVFVREQDVYG
jgi:hypothetical protein